MSGGGSTRFTPTSTRIDPSISPYRDMAVQGAATLYGQGAPDYFSGQNWVDPSANTLSALNLTQQRAMAGSPLVDAAQGSTQNLTGFANPALSGYQSMVNQGYADPSSPFYRNLQGGAYQNEAGDYLRSTANGDYLNGNQFFDGAFRAATQGATNQFNDSVNSALSNASLAGRYGSNAMDNILNRVGQTYADSLNNTAGSLAYNNYASERARQEAAVNALGGLSQQDILNRFSGAQALTSGSQNAFTNQLNALSGLGSTATNNAQIQLGASQLAPTLANQDYFDINQLLQAGQIGESYDQAKLAGQMDRWMYETQAPYQLQSWYGNFLSGIPQGADTTRYNSTTSGGLTSAQQSWLQSQGLI